MWNLKNAFMKSTLTIWILFSFTTVCMAIDRMPEIRIKIDKSIISEVDSVYLIKDFQNVSSTDQNEVSPNQKWYSFSGFHGKSRISIKLKNSYNLLTDTTLAIGRNATIIIKKHKNKIYFQEYHQSVFWRISKILVVLLIALLFVKLPIAMLIISPISKRRFLVNFAMTNLIYFVVFFGLIGIMRDTLSLVLFPLILMITISDLFFLKSRDEDCGIVRLIFATLISNVLYFTTGLLLMFLIPFL